MSQHLADAATRALAEGATFRGVRRARLTLPDREAEFATRAALEDALRTADFGDAGRLIVVRRLQLAGLPRGASGPQIARALERAWQSLAPSALAFDAPGAERANVVYFRSTHAARLAWLRRVAHDDAPREWFWPRALPELAQGSTPGVLAQLLAALQVQAPRELAREIIALPVAAIGRLLAALPAARVDALLACAPAAHASPMPAPGESKARAGRERGEASPNAQLPAGGAQPAEHPSARAAVIARSLQSAALPVVARLLQSAALRERIAALASDFGPSDWRFTWFVALAVRAETGAVPALAAAAALIEAMARSEHAIAYYASVPRAAPRTASPPEASPRPNAALRVDAGLPARSPRAPPARGRPGMDRPWLEDNRFTAFGGLLMLLNALQVLQFPSWLRAQAAPVREHFGRALLARVATRLGVSADDPQQPLFTLDEHALRALRECACDWQAFRWPRGFDAGRLVAPPAAASVSESLWRWQCALVRLLRRHAGIGLAHVVRRAAGVSVTPTHVDIVLPLADADPALRRTGLDRDPGWVAWFGWIVAFHYLDGASHDAG